MKVAGFTFIRNAVKNDYPIVEAILSILPLCDEFIVALGNSDDDTERLIRDIDSPKIRIINTVWDESIKEGGAVFAQETDKAYAAISPDTDWAFYIQGDECLHEKYLEIVKREMEAYLNDEKIEGLLFKYLHFYASFDFIASSRRWYRNEIRVLRYGNGIHSYRDAQGFRKNGRKLKVKLIDAYIYHYGWVKPPKGLINKVRNFNQFYTNEPFAINQIAEDSEFDYGNAHRLLRFEESHPAVMQKRVSTCNWKFSVDPTTLKNKMSTRYRVLQKLEDLTGWRIGEYKNYKKLS
ncbi:MAG: glycosyltransferase family 2 protein [Sphingobacteriaceae bacterium]|nr:glycosyltransferase family 2 protein [Sphingobacteriaceae bacterium]